ncbi:MAG: hypothetical protein RL684_2301 [Pseudomonadota bacterium]
MPKPMPASTREAMNAGRPVLSEASSEAAITSSAPSSDASRGGTRAPSTAISACMMASGISSKAVIAPALPSGRPKPLAMAGVSKGSTAMTAWPSIVAAATDAYRRHSPGSEVSAGCLPVASVDIGPSFAATQRAVGIANSAPVAACGQRCITDFWRV